jgi:hypothetical protein
VSHLLDDAIAPDGLSGQPLHFLNLRFPCGSALRSRIRYTLSTSTTIRDSALQQTGTYCHPIGRRQTADRAGSSLPPAPTKCKLTQFSRARLPPVGLPWPGRVHELARRHTELNFSL